MTITISDIPFQGPYSNKNVSNQAGVYVIVGRDNNGAYWEVVDVGESQNINRRLANHDREQEWARQGYNMLGVAICHVPDGEERRRIESFVRAEYRPPCGER